MCGIIGAIHSRSLPASVDKYIKNGLVVDAVRGAHSTGVCILSRTGEKRFWEVRKDAVCGGQFVETKYDPTKENANVTAVIGHNRYATVGGITAETAHPFKVGDIVGVHNGTLTGDWRTKLDCGKKIEVDSNGLMHSLMYRGAVKTFSAVSGAAAVVWTNIRTGKTYVYRNSQRPLHYAHTTTGVLIYGSEKMMVEWLADRNTIRLTPEGVVSFNTDTVYEITDGEVTELETVEMFREPFNYHNYGSQGDYYQRGHYSRFTQGVDDTDNGVITLGSDFDIVDIREQQFQDYKQDLDLQGCDDDLPSDTLVLPPSDVETRVSPSSRTVDSTGLYPVLGGISKPSLRQMYGSTIDHMKAWDGELPIATPLHLSDAQLRLVGYSRQGGVWFRRTKLTRWEKEFGIISEFAERPPIKATEFPFCDYDGDFMTEEYLESIHVKPIDVVTVAPTNLAAWRYAMDDYTTKFRKILFVNTLHKFEIKEATA